MNLLINNHEIIDEFNSYLEARPQTSELMLTDDDMQVIFKCSRMTLYRARRAGKLVSENDTSGRIVYPYSTVLIAVKTNKFKIRGLSKLSAIERLETFKTVVEL
ncbi:hypothetical protein [Porphyromonas levii]|uniref:Uncharacterized protein n=1 Tax=Porphyromonas levii TaxID=28114 RepID=A0A4Y8WSS2_9PORP|nr:hypothetical protein [Porphyromonas levii]TFH96565.1 hypothetical protein E4P47_02130 [Porphyromonas levii]TFH96810.1 hypothetical protein E4P48_03480 [Porphyromonas levii]